MQVPVVDDVPPSSAPDVFVVPYNSQSRLSVLANDTAAYGSLALTQTTSPRHGLIAMDTNASSILYTPRYRFNGFDRLLYSAKDLKGRDVTDSVLVRLATSPPTFTVTAMPHIDSIQKSSFLAFENLRVTYEDLFWNLDLRVSLRFDDFVIPSDQWAATVYAVAGVDWQELGSLAAFDLLRKLGISQKNATALVSRVSGNITTIAELLTNIEVRPPESYSGVGVLEVELCSEWGECSVRPSKWT
jgi:hypothetical protein